MTETLDQASMPRSPGGIMRSAREKAGLHLAVLSVNLKVSIKQLEALEADQFQHLPEPVFARALAAKVCRFLKIDSEPVLALMPQMTNGLKPLQLIESDNRSSSRLHRMDQPSGFKGTQALDLVCGHLHFGLGLLRRFTTHCFQSKYKT